MSTKTDTARSSYTVIKLGGSVLRSLRAYRRCAAALTRRVQAEPGHRLIVVVSARYGVTNRLARLAGSPADDREHAARDLLWSTGETYSVAVLTLALRRLGVDAVGLSVHECGLHVDAAGDVRFAAERFGAHATRHAVVVVPGFFALSVEQRITSLGRGGSDLTAVALAAGLGARRCELVKDVGGYFSTDPQRDAAATAIAQLSYEEALRLADSGCPVVQRDALNLAARAGVVIQVCALEGGVQGTVVGDANAVRTERGARQLCVA